VDVLVLDAATSISIRCGEFTSGAVRRLAAPVAHPQHPMTLAACSLVAVLHAASVIGCWGCATGAASVKFCCASRIAFSAPENDWKLVQRRRPNPAAPSQLQLHDQERQRALARRSAAKLVAKRSAKLKARQLQEDNLRAGYSSGVNHSCEMRSKFSSPSGIISSRWGGRRFFLWKAVAVVRTGPVRGAAGGAAGGAARGARRGGDGPRAAGVGRAAASAAQRADSSGDATEKNKKAYADRHDETHHTPNKAGTRTQHGR